MPVFVVGMLSSAIGYGLMSYMMTAAPLQVVNVVKLGTSANATIIQWHVVAMFAPSFFTGSLIARFGASRILWAGLLAYIATIFTALNATGFWPYWWALTLVGLGWNFLYIGGLSVARWRCQKNVAGCRGRRPDADFNRRGLIADCGGVA